MSYPVGTICIGQNFVLNTECNGMECVIVGALSLKTNRIHIGTNRPLPPAYEYLVKWADGVECHCEHHCLKRKDWYDEEKRAEDRKKVSKLIAACKKAAESAIEAGEKVDMEEGAK